MRPGALLLPCFLLAGCSGLPEGADSGAPWEPLECDPSGVTAIGDNAPPVEGLRGTDLEVVRRIAGLFDDEVSSGTPIDSTEGFARWSTEKGTIQASREEPELPAMYTYATWRGDYPTEARLKSAMVGLGAPASSLHVSPSASQVWQQTWQGIPIQGASGTWQAGMGNPAELGWYGSFDIVGLVELPPAQEMVADDELMATAQAYDRCMMDDEGRTEEAGFERTGTSLGPLVVMHDSLARLVSLDYTQPGEPGHCGFSRAVAVDVVTGAVHGPVPVSCE
jgi:hypothetical protein